MGAGQGPRLLRGILFADAGQRPALPEGVLFAGAGQRRALLGGVSLAGRQRRAPTLRGGTAMALLMGKTCIIDHHACIIPLFYFD